jgi:O-acetyl-ADP-ribose deacetylase (regulator of RNase III)
MIHYLQGDATKPAVPGNIIAHIVNTAGGWGFGFVVSLSKRYAAPEQAYRDLAKSGGLNLGVVQFVMCADKNDSCVVANMVAQEAYSKPGEPAIRYDALEECLVQVRNYATSKGLSVHMPRIGCGLAGGKWSEIEPIIERALDGVEVFVYDFVSSDRSVMIAWNK